MPPAGQNLATSVPGELVDYVFDAGVVHVRRGVAGPGLTGADLMSGGRLGTAIGERHAASWTLARGAGPGAWCDLRRAEELAIETEHVSRIATTTRRARRTASRTLLPDGAQMLLISAGGRNAVREHAGTSPRRRLSALAAAVVAIVALVCGPAASASGELGHAADRSSTRLVDIGGHRTLVLDCRGTGSPTVVLISGAGGAHDEWTHVVDPATPDHDLKPSASAVLPKVARFTRVCAYDRPGTARLDDKLSPSTPVAQPTTAQAGVADLRALLEAGHVRGPYVLVGASWGGTIASLFARDDPHSVAGLVFSDGASEFLKDTFTSDQWNAWMRVIATSTPPGREAPDYESSVAELRAAPSPSAVPAIVLTADKAWNLPLDGTAPTWLAWQWAQDRLTTLFHARHVTDTAAGHGIAVEDPRVVVDAIRSVVDAARNGATATGSR